MTRRYSHYHSLATFIEKCIPKRGSGSYQNLFIHRVIDGLKRLDATQQDNRSITLPFDVDGINVLHGGALICKITPNQDGLLVLNLAAAAEVTNVFDKAVRSGLIEDRSGGSYRSWKVPDEGLEVLWSFIEGLSLPTEEEEPETSAHPRAFPPALRQAAYEGFVQGGSICPGHGKQRRHKIDIKKGDRIEFDHILSYASGGPSTEWNIQVLCSECNRAKRARCD